MNDDTKQNAHIVIIEDQEYLCRSYVDLLVWKYEFNINNIQCFIDPREALVFLKENHQAVDVVLLDLKMPHIDGLDMLRHIRTIGDTLKIIVISAFAGIESVRKAVETSEKDAEILEKAVDKPIADFSELVKMIAAAYQLRRGNNDN